MTKSILIALLLAATALTGCVHTNDLNTITPSTPTAASQA
jgi:hypothetical protein